jgi:pimeloyl-ACP methyl ester carboxylesterase
VRRRPAAVLLTALLVAGCGGTAQKETTTTSVRTTITTTTTTAAPSPHLRAASDCGAPDGFACRAIVVPLHRRGPHAGDGRTLTLRVAVQEVPAPKGDLLFLSGGPGQAGIPFAARLASRLREAAAGYRLVVLDQRGTGANALRCDALQRQVGTSDIATPTEQAVRACGERLGDARDAYATADTVADLEALRHALGIARWTVGGISYGTLVAQRLALAHPRTVRGLVLDSVVPLGGAELLLRDPQRTVGRVLRAVCGTQCVADLRTLLRVGAPLGPRLLDALVARSIGVPRFGAIGAVLRQSVTTSRAPLARYLRESAAPGAIPPAAYSAGLHAATLCADSPAPWPGGAAATPAVRASAADAQQARMGPRATDPFPVSTAFGQGLLVTCRAWPVTAQPPAPDPYARIAVPALLLAGDRDLSTPLVWARAQAGQMDHARLVVVAGAGHSVLSREQGTTARTALRRFLAAID